MAKFTRQKKRILFVEDHEDNWEIVELTLAEYTLICARDFYEGLRLATLGYFDLYILDNWLPDRPGVELCRIIRRFDPNTPILFLVHKRSARRPYVYLYGRQLNTNIIWS